MTGRTHMAASAVVYTGLAGFNPVGLLFSIISSRLPDLDLMFWHRGITHSPVFLAGVYFLVERFHPELALPFLIGYGSHILLDSLTPMGIPWLIPLTKKRYGLPLVITSSPTDKLLGFVLISILVFIAAGSAWNFAVAFLQSLV